MTKLKVTTIIGTRPEIIRLSRIMAKLDLYCEHTLIHTGQNYDYELNEIFFEDLKIRRPDYFLQAAGKTAAETIGNVIIRTDRILEELRPDALLILGDTNSCLAALPAKRRKIPVFHMEAGNRCFDQRVPEEINRRMVDHIADINLPYSTLARENLRSEGFPADRIIKTGSPMGEVLSFYRSAIESSLILDRLGLEPYKYFVASIHREENIDSSTMYFHLMESLNAVAETYNCPIIVSTHPRTRKVIQSSACICHPLIRFSAPLTFTDYVKLQQCASAVLSDSGTICEEASILNFPALMLREAHERPEAMEETSVIMAGGTKDRILQALAIVCNQRRDGNATLNSVNDYDMKNVSEKVVRIIHSYTDYVNRVVWEKPISGIPAPMHSDHAIHGLGSSPAVIA